MKRPSISKTFQSIIVLVTLCIMGCESADIETGTTTTASGSTASNGSSPNGSNSNGSNPNGTTPGNNVAYTTLAVAPASTEHTSTGQFTVLEITSIAGYTYRWSLSDPSLGNISPTQGSKVTYFTTSIPSSGAAVQTITVIGTSSSSTVKYRGTSTITHRPN